MIIMNEWKDIKGYEGIYQAHPSGKLRSLDRYRTMTGRNKVKSFTYDRFLKGKVLVGGIDKDGYRIGVFHDSLGNRKTLKFHRLIAQTFIENKHNLPEVNHKDGNKTNNNANNLEWTSTSSNVQHAFDTGLKNMDWKKRAVVQLDKNTLEVIKVYESATATESDGFRRTSVGGCCRGDYGKKTHKGFIWKFLADFEGSTTIESTSNDGSE